MFPQHSPMNQSGYDQMQFVQQQKQQQMMLKQLHVLQMQQQQQNFVNPLNDSSQGSINWAQRNAFSGQQETLNRSNMFSMGHHNHVIYQEPSGQYDLSLQQGPYMTNLGVQKNTITEAGSFHHGLNDGTHPGNLLSQQFDTLSSGRQEEQPSWSSFGQKDTKLPQASVPLLDPLEEKILFNMEDSSISDIASGLFGEKFDTFPSMNSGSWSALMQTAVAEASSSDTVIPEEFSGLTYQNMELSTDINDISNFIDSEKQQQQAGYINNNIILQGSSTFPGFQVPSDQLRPSVFQEDSVPDSTHRSSSSMTGHWVDCNPQPKISTMSFDNLSTSNMYMQPSPGMLDQIQSQTGMSPLVPSQLRKGEMFPQFIQQRDPYVASQRDNATFSGGHSFGVTRSSPQQQGTNQQQFNVWMDLTSHQHSSVDQDSLKAPLNVINYSTPPVEILRNAQHMPQRVGLLQEHGAANTYDVGSKLNEQNHGTKLPRDSGVSSISQLNSFLFDDQKVEQKVCSNGGRSHLNLSASASMWSKQAGDLRNDQMKLIHDSPRESPDQCYKPLNTVNKQEEITSPKKRKLMGPKQLSWHEEFSNTSQKDHTISRAVQKWARATNILVEKAEYDTQTSEFAIPLHRSKRRLVLTTQLIQQLFDPPPSSVLLSAATSSFHKMLFLVARVTLGDACSLRNKGEPLLSPEVYKIPQRNVQQHYEVAKKLTEKAKKLEEGFERVEKLQSMADIKYDVADMERFSVINRFARFHSKGPVSGASSGTTIVKPIPERYIVVAPMPINLPQGAQCISL